MDLDLHIKSKYDYLKRGSRANVHTKIRRDLYLDFTNICRELNEPTSKGFDVVLEMILKNEDLLNEFRKKIKLY